MMSDIGTRVHFSEHDDQIAFERVQDCTPVIEHAQTLHKAGAHGSSDMRHAASIPAVVVEKYCNDNHISFQEFIRNPDHIKRICNNPENKMFRIWPGQL